MLPRSPRPRMLILFAALLIVLGLSSGLGSTQAQSTRRIFCVNASGGSTTPPCVNGVAYPTIQAAVNAAGQGDEIRIARGVYTSADREGVVVIALKSLIVRGGYTTTNWSMPGDASGTIIDAQGARRGVAINEASVVLANLTVRGGATPIGSNQPGGGIHAFLRMVDRLYLIDAVITNNMAHGSGGGVFAVGGPTIALDTVFQNNTTNEDGGGFYGYQLDMQGGAFISNQARRTGGGAAVYQSSFDGVQIVGNTAAEGEGGGLEIQSRSSISNSEIRNNMARDNGGGVHHRWATDTTLDIENSIIAGNQANNGGGIFTWEALQLRGVTIADNRARGGGGGIAAADNLSTLEIVDSRIANNQALTESGGGVWFMGKAVIEGSTITGNQAAKDGGGIWQQTPSSGEMTPTLTISGTRIADNITTQGNGGGVYINRHALLTHVHISGNAAGGQGGGLYQVLNYDYVTLRLEGALIENNRAEFEGGGIAVPAPATIHSAIVRGNTAGTRGGGVFAATGLQLRVIGVLFANNRSGTSADAVYLDRSGGPDQAVLTNITIASSERSPHAAIQLDGANSSLTLRNSSISNHAVGIQRQAGSAITGDYNAFFNNGADQQVAGTTTALPFTHLVTADPLFADPSNGDFHLREGSPLIDMGDPAGNYAGQRDMDGMAVPYGNRADIGADEFFPVRARILLPSVMRMR